MGCDAPRFAGAAEGHHNEGHGAETTKKKQEQERAEEEAAAKKRAQEERSAARLKVSKDKKKQPVLHRVDRESHGGVFDKMWERGKGVWVRTARPLQRATAWLSQKAPVTSVQEAKNWPEDRTKIRIAVSGGWLEWAEGENACQHDTNKHTSCGRHDPVDFSFVEPSFVWPREFPSEIKQASLLILDKGENTLLCKSTIDFVCLSISSRLLFCDNQGGDPGKLAATPPHRPGIGAYTNK